MMLKHPFILFISSCFIVNLVFSIIFASNILIERESTEQIRNAPLPIPLFQLNNSVIDLHLGQSEPLESILKDDEHVFIMFYAPWSVTSREIIFEFEKAAKYLDEIIKFVAVNCWYPAGSCRILNKFKHFPQFYYYIVGFDGIKYNGPLQSDYFVHFIERVTNPLTFISTTNQLPLFLSKQENSIVGYFDFATTLNPPGFISFYHSALLLIGHDFLNAPYYGVLTISSIAASVSLLKPSSIVLIRIFNSTLKLENVENYPAEKLFNWILNNKQISLMKNVYTSEHKSLSLSKLLNDGKSIFLLQNIKPVSPFDDNIYSMVSDLSFLYNDCNKLKYASESFQSGILKRFVIHRNIDNKNIFCKDFKNISFDKNYTHYERNAQLVYVKVSCCLCSWELGNDVCVQRTVPLLTPQFIDMTNAFADVCNHAQLIIQKLFLRSSILHNKDNVIYNFGANLKKRKLLDKSFVPYVCCNSKLKIQRFIDFISDSNINQCENIFSEFITSEDKCSNLPSKEYCYVPYCELRYIKNTCLVNNVDNIVFYKDCIKNKFSNCKIGDYIDVNEKDEEQIFKNFNFLDNIGCNMLPIKKYPYVCYDHIINYNIPYSMLIVCIGNSTMSMFTKSLTNTPSIIMEWMRVKRKPLLGSLWVNEEVKGWKKEKTICSYYRQAEFNNWMHPNSPVKIYNNLTMLRGARCSSNSSISNFYLGDFLNYNELLISLGFKNIVAPFILLVDLKNEFVQGTAAPKEENELISLILNFEKNQLYNYKRSAEIMPPPKKSVSIVEINANIFQKIISSNKDVILLFYSRQCIFCYTFSHTFLATSLYLQRTTNLVFARIDSDRNDLPLEYRSIKVPAIMFIPSFRKSETVVLPHTYKMNLQHLLFFILSNASPFTLVQILTSNYLYGCNALCRKNHFAIAQRMYKILKMKSSMIIDELIDTVYHINTLNYNMVDYNNLKNNFKYKYEKYDINNQYEVNIDDKHGISENIYRGYKNDIKDNTPLTFNDKLQIFKLIEDVIKHKNDQYKGLFFSDNVWNEGILLHNRLVHLRENLRLINSRQKLTIRLKSLFGRSYRKKGTYRRRSRLKWLLNNIYF